MVLLGAIRLQNEDIQIKVMWLVVDISREARRRWFEHVKRRFIDTLVRRCERLVI